MNESNTQTNKISGAYKWVEYVKTFRELDEWEENTFNRTLKGWLKKRYI